MRSCSGSSTAPTRVSSLTPWWMAWRHFGSASPNRCGWRSCWWPASRASGRRSRRSPRSRVGFARTGCSSTRSRARRAKSLRYPVLAGRRWRPSPGCSVAVRASSASTGPDERRGPARLADGDILALLTRRPCTARGICGGTGAPPRRGHQAARSSSPTGERWPQCERTGPCSSRRYGARHQESDTPLSGGYAWSPLSSRSSLRR